MKWLGAGGLCVASLLVAGSSHAHWEFGATLVGMNLGYAVAKSSQTKETVHGATYNGSLEFVVPHRPVSFGVAFASVTFDENGDLPEEVGGGRAEIRYRSTPFYGTCKLWFGGNRVRGYTGVGAGFHTSKLETSVRDEYRLQTSTGVAIGVPLGAVLFLGDRVFLNANAVLNILGDSLYDSNLSGLANFGVGFKLSDW